MNLIITCALLTSTVSALLDFENVGWANANRARIAAAVNSDPDSSWWALSVPAYPFTNTPYNVLVRYGAGVLGGDPRENDAGLPIKRAEDIALRWDGAIPDAFEAKDAWPQCSDLIAEIRDQSACGSCYAVSAASAATDRFCIAYNGTVQDRLSDVDLMSCCKTCAGSNGGCYGGTPSYCWDYISTQGIATGGAYGDNSQCLEYPFAPCSHHVNGSYPTCPDESYNAPTCFWECDLKSSDRNSYDEEQAAHMFKTSYRVESSVTAIQADIIAHGPSQASMYLTDDFEVYAGGVFSTQSKDYIGAHAVKIVGWGVDAGISYWTVQNSWNDEWGEEGYFRIERGIDCLAIESGVVAGTVDAW